MLPLNGLDRILGDHEPKLSREQLAVKAGITYSTLRSYERGTAFARADENIARLAHQLECSVHELYGLQPITRNGDTADS